MLKVGDEVSITLDKRIVPNYTMKDGTVGKIEKIDSCSIEVIVGLDIYYLFEYELELLKPKNPIWEI